MLSGSNGGRAMVMKAEVSIHAPRVGGDSVRRESSDSRRRFQSTPPAWGATWHTMITAIEEQKFQSTPPAWGATIMRRASSRSRSLFQSTPPAWGATLSNDVS